MTRLRNEISQLKKTISELELREPIPLDRPEKKEDNPPQAERRPLRFVEQLEKSKA